MAKKAFLFALILVATSAWYGLAIAGFGGFAAFFSIDALIGLTAVGVAMVVVSTFCAGNLSSGQREDRGNRWVLAAFTILGLLDGYLPAWADRHDFWIIGGDAVRWIGVTLYAAGGAFRIWPVFVLGRRFSGLVAIQPDHTLVTNGIYRYVRNPSYLGALVMVLGWGLAYRTGVGVVLAGLFLPPMVARMTAEEALLADFFGDEYQAYRARTARLIPGIY